MDKRNKIIITSIVMALLMSFVFLILNINRHSTNQEDDTEDVVSEISTKDKRIIRQAVLKSLGRDGYPDKYPYDRPIDISGQEKYGKDWIVARVEILDEPPNTGNRYILYVLRRSGDEFIAIDPSKTDIPKEIEESLEGSHD